MNNDGNLRLKNPEVMPTSELLAQELGGSYAAYEEFQTALPGLDIEQDWQWYAPYKAWFAKGQYYWTTPRGIRKVKNLYWLYVYVGYFSVAVWFKEKNRAEILNADVSEYAKQLIRETKTVGKLPTFPAVFDVTEASQLFDIYKLLDCKKYWKNNNMQIIKADIIDLPSILALQKPAYQSEAEFVGDFTIPTLMQIL